MNVLAIVLIIFIFTFMLIYFHDNFPIIEGARSKKKKKFGIKKAFKKVLKKTGIKKVFKKPKPKRKPRPKKNRMQLKPAASADYSDNIVNPYEGNNYNTLKSDVLEYNKALNGISSSKLVSAAPLGKLYFYNTGVKCNSNGKQVDRYSVIDAREGILKPDGSVDKSIFSSAVADFNRSTLFKDKPNYSETIADKCIPITIEPVDVYGRKQPEQTQHVAVLDIQNYNNIQLGKEPFVSGGLVIPDFKRMDLGQKTFIWSTALLGLYLFHKGIYPL
jgi:hypothetical protein